MLGKNSCLRQISCLGFLYLIVSCLMKLGMVFHRVSLEYNCIVTWLSLCCAVLCLGNAKSERNSEGKKKSIWNCEKSGEHGEEKIRRRPFHFREDLKMLICNYSIFNCFCTL